MTEAPIRRRLPFLGALWLTLALGHAVLQGLAPRSILGDPLLPSWAKICLLAFEWGLLAAAVAAVAGLFGALSAATRVAPRLGTPLVVLGSVVGALLLLAVAVSWSMFWLSGQFLDGPGLRFAVGNFGSLLAYGTRIHPVLVFGMPALLLASSVAAGILYRTGLDRLPARVGSCTGVAATGLLVLTLATAVAGEVGHRYSSQKVTDPATGAVYSRDELYRLRRDRNAGPLAHWIARSLGSRDPLDSADSDPPVGLLCRPQVSMDQYLSTVDRSRLRPWNVIVILVDSLRADQLRATGGSREVMPEVEGLAREGKVFVDCVTQASHTDYAAPAVFSSHYPLRSRDVYRYPKDPAYPRVMVYDVLKALGWRTALYSSQNEEWGQMLDYLQTGGLDVCFHSKSPGASKDRPAFSGTLDDAVTVSESIKWIGTSADPPFFLYLNLQNSHLPYDVPQDFPRRFGPATLDFKISIGWYPAEKTSVVKEVYADSLAYVDAQLGRLFRHVKQAGQWDRTLVVLTGDHGEAFYEHGTAAHANGVYDETIRVPLVIRAPGLEAGRDDRPTQLLDVAPGVLHLIGLPVHPSFQGEDPFAPSFRKDRTRYVVSDTPWKTHLGVLRCGFKLIRDGDTGRSVLYERAGDPAEKTDASAAHPDLARDLSRRLSAWRRAQLDYYDNPIRQSREYPPVLSED
ncbi:MAG TPA: sulfatase [Planctomycetota bacterium]|nr:sulfatase [Planctomycetota bacterium]